MNTRTPKNLSFHPSTKINGWNQHCVMWHHHRTNKIIEVCIGMMVWFDWQARNHLLRFPCAIKLKWKVLFLIVTYPRSLRHSHTFLKWNYRPLQNASLFLCSPNKCLKHENYIPLLHGPVQIRVRMIFIVITLSYSEISHGFSPFHSLFIIHTCMPDAYTNTL